MLKPRRGRGRLVAAAGVVFAAGILGAPAGASATTFYVDDSATSPHPNCINPTPANACETIGDGITQARDFAGPDTIMVAAGNYPEEFDLNDDDDAGLTIDGAGTSTGGSGTVLQLPAGTGVSVVESNVTIRDMLIQASNFETLFVGSFVLATPSVGQHLENVEIELNDEANLQSAIRLSAANDAVLDDVIVSGDANWDGGADAHALEVANSTNVTVNDSRLLSNSRTVFARASTLDVNRSLIVGPFDFADPVLTLQSDLLSSTASLTMDSSVVALGSQGLAVRSTGTTSTATALVRNSTIDPGVPKGTPDLTGVGTSTVGSMGPVEVGLENSIVVGALTTTGTGPGTIACSYSDVPNTVEAEIDCPTTPGNPGNNSSSTPAVLFVPGGFLGLDWHLLSTSPAIDSGSPDALEATESTTDLDANSRLLDGNLDCVVRRDKGAYEITGQSASCPTTPPPGVTPPGGGGSTAADPCAKLRSKLKRAKGKQKRRKLRRKLKRCVKQNA